MKKENQYLEEDRDLLDELDSIGPMSTGVALSEQQRKISVIQIKSVLRNTKTLVDLDKSNKKYTRALGLFALLQIVIATLQLILDIKNSRDIIFSLFIGVLLSIVLIGFIRELNLIEK